MLLDDLAGMIQVRGTGRISAKGMAPVREILSRSSALERFDRRRKPECRDLKFTSVQMLTVLLFCEIKGYGVEQYKEATTGRGSQVVLKNLGMPRGKGGAYIAPSPAWLSTFKNGDFKILRHDLEEELRGAIVALKTSQEATTVTIDSTPLEASRYSKWADFNPHYKIWMAKCHIVMMGGTPIHWTFTNGNCGDNPQFRRMLEGLENRSLPVLGVHADGGYDSVETYVDVFLKTGKTMHGNPGSNAKVHKEYLWKNMLKRYNRLFRERDFVPAKRTSGEHILRYLVSHGEREAVGYFLRNVDISRGKKLRKEGAHRRHICETVHHGMKRWIQFDVRGLHSKHIGPSLSLKMLTCTILSILFRPYTY